MQKYFLFFKLLVFDSELFCFGLYVKEDIYFMLILIKYLIFILYAITNKLDNQLII